MEGGHDKGLAPRLARRLESTSDTLLFVAGLAAVVLVGLVNWGVALAEKARGPEFSFVLFYAMPILAVAWFGRRAHALLLAVVGALLGFLLQVMSSPDAFSFMGLHLWNAGVRFGTYALGALILARLRHALQAERRQAMTDPLTGAANTRRFYLLAQREVYRMARSGRPVSLAYVDLDDFKRINDHLGHAEGDALLQQVAACFRRHVRPTDVVARIGGDEFAILFPETDAPSAARAVRRLLGQIDQSMKVGGEPVGLSVGLVTFAAAPRSVGAMLRRADEAMYSAKRNGKGRVVTGVWEGQQVQAVSN